jgi:hypothetical protein
MSIRNSSLLLIIILIHSNYLEISVDTTEFSVKSEPKDKTACGCEEDFSEPIWPEQIHRAMNGCGGSFAPFFLI